ncbi:MAG: proline--tRNA ligase [Gammaproteobacteria bacterium]|nr:proline--tRNA ligase [Gammaproteobacteria bacterium]
MKASRYTISTLKETPADAEVISHQLLVRGGFIRKLASGLYTWLPIGLKVLQKVEQIIRQEMNNSGAQELLMPVVQPAELWKESGRWDEYDDGLLLKLLDRHQRDFCFGPTHEEVITDLARNELKSHKQLPVNFYQIQTKFRDETRPRFGLLRTREFLMKDAYSFHMDMDSLEETYQEMHDAYSRILNKMSLNFRPVQADSGSIGGSASMEFHVLADSGEDKIAFSTESDYATNIELAEALAPEKSTAKPKPLLETATPGIHTISEVSEFLKVNEDTTLKTLIFEGSQSPLVALVLRGDHQLNELKAGKLPEVAMPLKMASDDEIKSTVGCSTGSIGPIDLEIPVLVDRSADALANFVCGANKDGFHYQYGNWGRDCKPDAVYDLRDVVEGDPSPDGNGQISCKRGIEVGHIFQLGDKYSRAMNATVLDENGKAVVMVMGCYGMGVSRLVSAIVEQNHDDKGIIWPTIIAPFQVIIVPINAHKSAEVAKVVDNIYTDLQKLGIEVLLDDRDGHRPGVKFADAELMGIPHRLVVGERGLGSGVVEYVERQSGENQEIATEDVVQHLKSIINRKMNP